MSLLSTITSVASGGMSTVYKYAAILGAVLAIAVGSYFYGLHVGDMKSKLAIAQLTTKYQTEESNLLGMQTQTNTKIVTQYVTRTVTIHDNSNQIQQQIAALPPSVLLSPDWVRLYNDSIGAPDSMSSTTGPANAGTGSVEANRALITIADNNAECLNDQARLSALQQFVQSTQQNIATVDNTKSKK